VRRDAADFDTADFNTKTPRHQGHQGGAELATDERGWRGRTTRRAMEDDWDMDHRHGSGG